jgi:hypothetical protein
MRIRIYCLATAIWASTASLTWAGSEGQHSTFYGYNAGSSNVSDTYVNTFIGSFAGYGNTSGSTNTFVGGDAGWQNVGGSENAFLGEEAGNANITGSFNTYVGRAAGLLNDGDANTFLGRMAGHNNASGSHNVFLGNGAGYSELGSNTLYIDSCYSGGFCTAPFIYGEFDSHLLKLNGVLNVRANGVARSQMHFSKDDTDTGGFLTSVLDNNFFMSSGARFDATAGNWIQLSPDKRAVIAGSGSLGYRIFTDSGQSVSANFTPTVRLHMDYDGNLGLNQLAVSGTPIQHISGAHLTSGGVWTDASSRSYKEHIETLSTTEAQAALAALQPVKFNYKVDREEKYVGFIAEDVPELVARKDRKSLSPMDIVAVLTKVVQERGRLVDTQRTALDQQKKTLDEKSELIAQQQQTLEAVVSELAQLRMEVEQIKGRMN